MIAHHTMKTVSEGVTRLDIWGSQFLNAFLETGWQIRTLDESGTALEVLRHFKSAEKQPPIKLVFDIDTQIHPSRFEVRVTQTSPPLSRSTESEISERQRALAWLRQTFVAGGRLRSYAIRDMAAKENITKSTLYRAKGVYTTSDGKRIKTDQDGKDHYWIIPPEPDPFKPE